MKSPDSNANLLTAHFKLDLSRFPGYLIGEGEQKSVSVAAEIDGYDVDLRLESNNGIGLKRAQDAHGRFIFNSLIARISHGETGFDMKEPDGNDGRLLFCLFSYQEILVAAANRLVRYFKYRLRNPQLRAWRDIDFVADEKGYCNPHWEYAGQSLHRSEQTHVWRRAVYLKGMGFLNDFGFGVEHFTPERHTELQVNLHQPCDVDLFDQLLSDAQTALTEGNLRRAVLEIAIAAEVFVKNTLSKLPERQRLQDLDRHNLPNALERGAQKAWGVSFQSTHSVHFENIRRLTSARNSIAHAGQCRFADAGEWHEVTVEDLKAWWTSVLHVNHSMSEYLRSVRTVPQR